MGRRNDDTAEVAVIFFKIFLQLLSVLGAFFLWLFRSVREKKRKELEAVAEPSEEDLVRQELINEIHLQLDNDLENNEVLQVEARLK